MGTRRLAIVIAATALLLTIARTPAATAAAVLSRRSPTVKPLTRPRPYFGLTGVYQPLEGDFDGDGRADIFWYAPGAGLQTLWWGGADRHFTARNPQVFGSYRPIVADFNGDGRADIVWYKPGSVTASIWMGNADRSFTPHPFRTSGGDYEPIAGDFNGDGHADILWYAPGEARDYEWFGHSGGTFTWRGISLRGWYRLSVGDLNGDGRDDVLFASRFGGPSYAGYAQPDGSFNGHVLAGITPTSRVFAVDANHDGRDDVFVYNRGVAPDWIWYSGLSVAPLSQQFSSIDGVDYEPIRGDFDGDGHDDIFWYAPGRLPDPIWFDVAHDIPPARGDQPHLQWKIGITDDTLPGALTVDDTMVYATMAGELRAYARTTGLPQWSDSAPCAGTLHRQLEVLKLECSGQDYVYDAATGALLYHEPSSECSGDNPYYDVTSVSGHLTVVAARTGAVVWHSPAASGRSCAISHDRLMAQPVAGSGVVEYSIATHQQVFADTQGTVYRFAPGGSVAMCDANEHLVALKPDGTRAWSTTLSCDGSEAPQDFGRAVVDRFLDIEIATGRALGVVHGPPGVFSYGGHSSANGAVFTYSFGTVPANGCITDSAALAFEGPYGVSPTLPAAVDAGFDFSNRAIAVLRPDPGGCHAARVVAFDERGTFRWTMPADVQLDLNQPIGNDMATNGGDESSALAVVGTPDPEFESHNLELVDLSSR